MHKRCSGIRDRLTQTDDFTCQTRVSLKTNTAKICPGIALDGPSLEVEKKSCYLGAKIGADLYI